MLWGLPLLLTLSPAFAQSTQPASTPEDLQSRYQHVLSILKSPPAPGILIAEFAPNSPALSGGCSLGDIITAYGTAPPSPITSEQSLRTAIATAIAQKRLDEHAPGQISVQICRLNAQGLPQNLSVSLPLGALGITGLEAQPGVPLPLNPPGTPRTDFALAWEKLPTVDPAPNEISPHEHWTRLYQNTDCIAFERTRLQRGGHSYSLEVLTSQVSANAVYATQTITLNFLTSDNQNSPGFQLDTLALNDSLTQTDTLLTKLGISVRAVTDTIPLDLTKQKTITRPTIPIGSAGGVGVVPVYALPLIAAALPQQADITLPFAQLSEVDYQTRLGYAFKTLGKTQYFTVPDGNKSEAWTIQVLHFAHPEMIFYFDDSRNLLQADWGNHLVSQTVATEAQATAGIVEK